MYVSTSSADRDTLLRTIRFERPDYIPMTFHINAACWDHYDQDALQQLMAEHPFLFPNFQTAPTPLTVEYDANARADAPYTDDFGCEWHTTMNGIVGSVLRHPLADMGKYPAYQLPDPEYSNGLGSMDWAAFEAEIARQKAAGEMTYGDLRHGHTFQQLCDIRGYMDTLMDLSDGEEDTLDLLERLCQFNLAQIHHFLKADVDMVRIPEDLGMQTGPMISPALFHQYIKPLYQRMLQPVREAGKLVHMHSDGDIRTLVDDIIDGGVDVINLQDCVNGVDWIGGKFRGKTCVDLDIDRQNITRFGTPRDIDAHIRRCIETVGCKEGGLMLIYG
ncbi:MAG: hypothetical protein IJO41_02410, partial [Oscillospiraceae bacterium]|nr:hypothetical protein [Oscillospiraceae bacterium]